MKKITCVGYHYTGSGVIDDIFRECDNVYQGTYGAELKLLHSTDGVSDLEYHLVENPNRLTSGTAIKRYIAYVKDSERQAKKIVGPEWASLGIQYAESLAQIKYRGYVAGDMYFFTPPQRLRYLVMRLWDKVAPKKYRHPLDSNLLPSVQTYYSSLSEEEFLEKTRKYIEDICERANKANKEYIMLDQFIGTGNPSRFLRYVNDMKVFIVDRDPRDIFLSRVPTHDRVLPQDIHQFCYYYRSIRKMIGGLPSESCMKVNFEDLIYHYEEYLDKVLSFVGIDKSHHIYPKKHFDPSISARGTKLWLNHPEFSEEIKIIERELPDFLYKYDDK